MQVILTRETVFGNNCDALWIAGQITCRNATTIKCEQSWSRSSTRMCFLFDFPATFVCGHDAVETHAAKYDCGVPSCRASILNEAHLNAPEPRDVVLPSFCSRNLLCPRCSTGGSVAPTGSVQRSPPLEPGRDLSPSKTYGCQVARVRPLVAHPS